MSENNSLHIVELPDALRPARERPPVAPRKDERLDETAETYLALVTGTRDYVRKNGFDKVYLGLSGGVDSALTAVIAADAIGAENVNAVYMPTQYSSSESGRDAEQLAKNLGLHFQVIEIGERRVAVSIWPDLPVQHQTLQVVDSQGALLNRSTCDRDF